MIHAAAASDLIMMMAVVVVVVLLLLLLLLSGELMNRLASDTAAIQSCLSINISMR